MSTAEPEPMVSTTRPLPLAALGGGVLLLVMMWQFATRWRVATA